MRCLLRAEELRRRVEEQHRAVIEAIRSGALDAEIASAEAATQASRPNGIQVQLLNPGSWLSAGKVSLELEVSRKADRQPQAGAAVKAVIEGALADEPIPAPVTIRDACTFIFHCRRSARATWRW